MHGTLVLFVALEIPVFFLFATVLILLRRKPPQDWLPRLLAFEVPLVFAGGVGLPLWALWSLLGTLR